MEPRGNKKPQRNWGFKASKLCGLDGTRTFYRKSPFHKAFERVKIERHRIAHLLTNFNLFNIKNERF